MGAVYLAEHEARAHVRCVIKFVLAELAQNPMVISRYKTETEAVSLLKHDNIVKLHDFGVLDDGQLFMCFEYIEGKSLERYVADRGGRLELRKAAYFIFQLCDALQHAHERGVIHRDLKPDNLIIEISPPGSHLEERMKILDFGIAKVASTAEHTGSGISMGTPRYMAPEQVTNAASATAAADVFSLATIFYRLVTGNLPWGTPESDVAIYHLQRTEKPAPPLEDLMPADLAAVVMRALSIKPALRPTTREFAVAIAAAIPREGDLESGTEILEHVKRTWVTSSLPHVPTLSRPVAAGLTRSLTFSPDMGSGAESDAAQVSDVAQAAPLSVAPGPSAADLATTANERPRSRPGSVAPGADERAGARIDAVSSSPHGAEEVQAGAAARVRSERPPMPVLAALPTGLLSQRFAVQPAPADAGEPREESIIVASEIDLAAGTPGPQPYAHAELPAVLVSNTQLSAASPSIRPAGAPFLATPESPPVLVLPVAPRSRSRRWLVPLIAASICIGTAAVVAGLVLRIPAGDRDQGAPRAAGSGFAPGVVGAELDAGVASEGVGAAATTPPVLSDMGQPPPAPRVASTASPPASSPTPRGPVESTAESSKDATTSSARPVAGPNSVAKPVERHGDPPAKPAKRIGDELSDAATNRPQHAASQPPDAPSRPQAPQPAPRAEARKGKVTILVTPWALVWLDGKPLDQTPVVLDDVPAGRHRLRLQNSIVKQDETTTIVVTPEQPLTIQRTW